MPRNRSLAVRALIVPLLALGALFWVLHQGGFAYARVAAFAILFVLAIDLASFARGAVQNVLVVVATLLFGVGALELFAQAMEPRVVLDHPPALWTDRPVLGWGPKAGGTFPVEKRVDGKTIYRVTYTIDDDLLRHTSAASDGPTIGFFGDSFTFGEGLNDADTLAQSFADVAPGFHAVNLAFSAYSPSQVLRELEVGMFDKELSQARAFVLQTGPWHAERTSCKASFSVRGPRYVAIDGKPRYEGPCATGIERRVEEFYKEMAAYEMFLAPLLQRPSHDDIETYIDIVGGIAAIAREKYGVPLIVLYVAPEDRYLAGTGFTDAEIRARLVAAGVHLVDAALPGHTDAVLTISGDGHPSGTANRLQARKLVDDFRRTMPDVLKLTDSTAGK